MTSGAPQKAKVAIGLLLGLAIGALCRWIDVPSPAPPVLAGAMLVVAMTVGYIATDRWFAKREAKHSHLCGGPDGSLKKIPWRPLP
jgi:XapX domain-containing protein